MTYWRVVWKGETRIIFYLMEMAQFLNEHPGASAQTITI